MNLGPRIGEGRTAEIFAYGEKEIVKLFRKNVSLRWVDWEIGMNAKLLNLEIPIPKMRGVVEVDGRKGILFERITGVSMLHALKRRPWKLAHFACQLAEVQWEIHQCPAPELPSAHAGLADSIQRGPQLSEEQKQVILEILNQLPEGNKLCHGDLHPDNILLSPKGPIVIDWTNACQGSPLADAARSSLVVRAGARDGGFLIKLIASAFNRQYVKHYVQLSGCSEDDLKRWELPLLAARLTEGLSRVEERWVLARIDFLLEMGELR